MLCERHGACDVFCDVFCDVSCDVFCDAYCAGAYGYLAAVQLYVYAESHHTLMLYANAYGVYVYLLLMKIPYYSINKEKK